MKKIITTCLLVVTLLLGGISLEAKTTRSNTSHKTSRSSSQSGAFSITSLLHKETNYGTTGFRFNSDANIEAALEKAGFSLKSKNVTKGEIEDGTDGDTAPGKIINYVYSKKGITVEWSSYAYDEAPNDLYKDAIKIKFSDNHAKDAFIKSMKTNGYRKEYEIYRDAGNMIHIEVKGNTVILYGNWA